MRISAIIFVLIKKIDIKKKSNLLFLCLFLYLQFGLFVQNNTEPCLKNRCRNLTDVTENTSCFVYVIIRLNIMPLISGICSCTVMKTNGPIHTHALTNKQTHTYTYPYIHTDAWLYKYIIMVIHIIRNW